MEASCQLINTHKLGLETSKGEADEKSWRAVIRSKTALVAASADDMRIIGKLGGKNSAVSVSCCELLEGIYNTCNSESVREMKVVIRSKASLIVASADDVCIIEKLRGKEFYYVRVMLRVGRRDITLLTAIVYERWIYIPCGTQEGRLSDFLWTTTCVPGGANDVRL